MTLPSSPASAASVGAGVTFCQSCGHDADLHSASWGCIAPVSDFEGWYDEPCGCMKLRASILGDAP